MLELQVLRTVELKGRVRPEDAATSLGLPADVVGAVVGDLVAGEFCIAKGPTVRLAPAGRLRLAELLERERESVDAAAIRSAYGEFCDHNGELKQVITAWQLKDGSTPNDHADAAYDAAVLARLTDLHQRVDGLIESLGLIAPRLTRYVERLRHAHTQIVAGDTSWVARPIADSYHTVWFELHEDLIHLCGLTRLEEAVAGRAH